MLHLENQYVFRIKENPTRRKILTRAFLNYLFNTLHAFFTQFQSLLMNGRITD